MEQIVFTAGKYKDLNSLLSNDFKGHRLNKYREMVFCFQNCSDLVWELFFCDREKLLKFEAKGWEFAKILRSLEQFIQTVKGQNNFW